jgi:hypothetical protein
MSLCSSLCMYEQFDNLRSAKRIVMKFDIGEFTALCPQISVLVKIVQQ